MSILRNSIYLTISQSVVFVLGILVSIVVARVLGPADRGLYFLLLTVNYMIVSFGNFGVGFTNFYLLSKSKRTLGVVNSSSMILAASIGIFFILLYLLFYNFLHKYLLNGIDPFYTMLTFCLVPLALYGNYWEAMLSGLNKFELLSKFNIVANVAGAISTFIVLLVLKLGIHGLIGWWLVNAFIFTLARLYITNRLERIVFSFDPKLLKEILCFGLKGHIGNVAWSLNNRLDMFIVNLYTGTTGLGHYSLAVSLAEKVWFVPMSLIGSSSPIISKKGKDEAVDLTAKMNRHTTFLSFVAAIFLLLIAPWGIPLLYGVDYSPSVIPLLVLLPGVIFGRCIVFPSYITGQLGKPLVSSIITLTSTTMYIPIAFVLIKNFGIMGAALSSTVCYIVQALLFFKVFNRESKVPFSEAFIIKLAETTGYKTLIGKTYKRFELSMSSFFTRQ